MYLTVSPEHPVKRRLTGQVDALVRQPWHDLCRRQAGIFRLVTYRDDLMFFLSRQFIGRYRTLCRGATVFSLDVPAPPGAQAEPHFPAGGEQTCAGANGFTCPLDKLRAFVSRGQSSSSSTP